MNEDRVIEWGSAFFSSVVAQPMLALTVSGDITEPGTIDNGGTLDAVGDLGPRDGAGILSVFAVGLTVMPLPLIVPPDQVPPLLSFSLLVARHELA